MRGQGEISQEVKRGGEGKSDEVGRRSMVDHKHIPWRSSPFLTIRISILLLSLCVRTLSNSFGDSTGSSRGPPSMALRDSREHDEEPGESWREARFANRELRILDRFPRKGRDAILERWYIPLQEEEDGVGADGWHAQGAGFGEVATRCIFSPACASLTFTCRPSTEVRHGSHQAGSLLQEGFSAVHQDVDRRLHTQHLQTRAGAIE